MPSYTIHKVTTRAELDAVTIVIWAAMPGNDRSHPIFYPILNDPKDDGAGSAAAKQRAIEQTQARLWQEHEADPASNWIYVCETSAADNEEKSGASPAATKHIVGGCQWRLYEADPFPNGMPEIEATWWPAGAGRAFATEVVSQCYRPRTVFMNRPHVGLSLMAVQPTHQRASVGSLLMRWGIEKADSMGVEMFIEATPQGRELYAKFGFRDVARVDVNMSGVDPTLRDSPEWQQLEHDLLPVGYTAMWRQIKGVWDEEQLGKAFAARLDRLRQLPSVTGLI